MGIFEFMWYLITDIFPSFAETIYAFLTYNVDIFGYSLSVVGIMGSSIAVIATIWVASWIRG